MLRGELVLSYVDPENIVDPEGIKKFGENTRQNWKALFVLIFPAVRTCVETCKGFSVESYGTLCTFVLDDQSFTRRLSSTTNVGIHDYLIVDPHIFILTCSAQDDPCTPDSNSMTITFFDFQIQIVVYLNSVLADTQENSNLADTRRLRGGVANANDGGPPLPLHEADEQVFGVQDHRSEGRQFFAPLLRTALAGSGAIGKFSFS